MPCTCGIIEAMQKHFKIIFILFLIAPVLAWGQARGSGGKMTYKQISQEQAKTIMQQRSDIIIVDARTFEEFAEGHISDAVCIPVESIQNIPPKELGDKKQTVLVYCRSGRRSKIAAQKLAEMGYENILEFGGIITWKYEIVK